MSGPFGSSQWMYSSGFYPYAIDNSLRFNDDDSANLSRTFGSAGNRKTWTWSSWVKRGNIGVFYPHLFRSGATMVRITDGNALQFERSGGGVSTSALFRDVSAWYHIVFALDTTQATASDRLKIYVNGVQQDTSGTYPALNTDYDINNNTAHYIGQSGSSSQYLDGYLADVHFIDGTALDASSFGETKSGIWVAKAYSGSYGTNGFYLKFDGNVNDSSGNGNNWTANNISSNDYVPDSPTDNFCTLNPLFRGGEKSSSILATSTLSDGNLKASVPTNSYIGATMRPTSGAWYCEATINTVTLEVGWGWLQATEYSGTTAHAGVADKWGGYYHGYSPADIYIYDETTILAQPTITLASSDVLQWAWDIDAGKGWIGVNNSWYDASGGTTGDPASGSNPTFTFTDDEAQNLQVYVANGTGTAVFTINFGQQDFNYTPPSGFSSLSSSNLPAPAIDPAVDDTPEDYFNTVLYTGNGSTQSITGVGFQPDWVWTKGRSNADNNSVFDIIRGVGQELVTNGTNAEAYDANLLTSFDSDGFSVGSNGGINGSSKTYVGWSWKAGGTAVSNTDGSITSSVSANTEAGFSIVSYTGNGTQNQTIGHGLTAAPEMIIVKNRDESDSTFDDWWVYHIGTSVPKNRVLRLNETTAELPSTDFWYNNPTSTVFGVNDTGSSGYTNDNTRKYIAYCFHSVEGYSKVGSYVGNGSSDGSFVYTGFRPAWVMVKRSDSTGNWYMWDDVRHPGNDVDNVLYADLSNAESVGSSYGVDFLSNGFKVRHSGTDINASGGNFIYLAFAEQPQKYANAR